MMNTRLVEDHMRCNFVPSLRKNCSMWHMQVFVLLKPFLGELRLMAVAVSTVCCRDRIKRSGNHCSRLMDSDTLQEPGNSGPHG